jgi:Na+-transporting NADH:ubiquinone oxidoreductase subunit A
MRIIKIKKGLDIPLGGKAENKIVQRGIPSHIAIKPTDFKAFQPRLLVREGDTVKAGTPLFLNKLNEKIVITAPVSGTISEIVRGEKRLLEEINIACDREITYETFPTLLSGKEDILAVLLRSGLFAMIRQRPYNIIPDPEVAPRDIYISTFDTSPLAPDYEFTLAQDIPFIQTAIDKLSLLPTGKVHLGLRYDRNKESIFSKLTNVEHHLFQGPHPTGNIGVQIHHTQPINKGDVVWYLNISDLVLLGKLFSNGIYDAFRKVAITGPEAKATYYAEVLTGTPIADMAEAAYTERAVRFISGNVLTGTKVPPKGYLGFYDHQVTLIPEGDYHEFVGWAAPGFKKFSASKTFMSKLLRPGQYKIDTNLHGGVRAFVMTGQYEKVFPFDIYPVYLIKAIMTSDIDKMEQLGIYEVAPEDFALCDVVCTSKIEVQTIVEDGLEMIRKEMS